MVAVDCEQREAVVDWAMVVRVSFVYKILLFIFFLRP